MTAFGFVGSIRLCSFFFGWLVLVFWGVGVLFVFLWFCGLGLVWFSF